MIGNVVFHMSDMHVVVVCHLYELWSGEDLPGVLERPGYLLQFASSRRCEHAVFILDHQAH